MWFSLFVVVLILAITFYQGLLGAFSAAINFFLAVLAAALAFGLYEDVYYSYLIDRQPDDGRGIALMGIFIVSLLVMRVIFDLLIKDNMHFSIYVDRVVGGIFGFLSAMIIIGTLAVGIQMLPFPYRWLGFNRYALYDADSGSPVDLTPKDDKEKEEDLLAQLDMTKVHMERKNLWLNPDGFTLALVSHLSDNALASSNSFARTNQTLLDDIHWVRFNHLGQKTNMARKADAISVQACWELPEDALFTQNRLPKERKIELVQSSKGGDKVQAGHRLIAVRAKLTADASDDGGGSFRFSTGQVRLVTKGSGGRTASYYLTGVNAGPEVANPKDRTSELYYRLPEGDAATRQGGDIDFVFELPKEAEPWFIEFRKNARAEIRGVDAESPLRKIQPKGAKKGNTKAGANDDADTDGKNTGGKEANGGNSNSAKPKPKVNMHTGNDAGAEGREGGRTKRYSADEEGSFFSNDLPLELTGYNKDTIETQSDKVLGGQGRLTAKLNAADDSPIKGNEPALKTFDVPSDKRLLHVSVRRLQPHSTLAQAMDFARQLGNVSVKDADGREYPAIGTWGIATVGRDRVFELVYYDQIMIDGSSAPPKLDVIRRGNMENNYALYYLFHIPPGKKIVRFMTPNSSGIDLTSANLVAPQ